MSRKENTKAIFGLMIVVLIFIISSYLVQNNLELFKSYIDNNFLSIVVYVLIIVLLIILAPINDIVLIPVATAVWGWFIAGLLTLIGWTIGSSIVFLVSRKYGAPIIKKFISLNNLYKYEKLMPKEHTFLGIIFLRVAIPADVISYAIGLFTKIRFWPYFFATLIGFLPLAFFLAYAGTLPLYIQIIAIIIFILVILIGYLSIKKKIK